MKSQQLRASAIGLSIHGPRFCAFVSDLSAAADRIASLEAEVDTLRRERDEARAEQMTDFQHDTQILGALQSEADALRAQLTAAQGLRIPLSMEVVKAHEPEGGRWLVLQPGDEDGPLSAEPVNLHVEAGIIRRALRWWSEPLPSPFGGVTGIPLDSNGQPCPVGGWGKA